MTRRGFLGAAGAALGLGGCGRGATETRFPPIGAFTEAEGLRIHYLDRGEGVPVVLIHGASGNLRDFSFSLAARLAAAGLRPIAVDRPGLGYSDRAPERGFDPAVQARVLRAAMDSIGVRRAIVAGHSWGGAVAMAWALDAPGATIGAMSIAGATYPWGGGVGPLYRMGADPALSPAALAMARAMVDEDDPSAILARIFRPDAPPTGYAAYIGAPLALRPDAFRHNAEDMANLNAMLEAQAPRYGALTMPVEAIHGAADRTVWPSIHSAPLVGAVANGRLTLLQGVGHMPHHAAEDTVVEGILRLAAAA
jgi:pimeloyl-ACP methyl ester carboxylesterase